MTTEIDVCRSAHALIQQHGEGAAIQAAMKANAMLDKGDLDRRYGVRSSRRSMIYSGRSRSRGSC